MRLAYVVNPAARSGRAGRRWPALARALGAAGLSGPVVLTRGPGEAAEAARALAAEAEAVVAVGGDGTVHEVVNGLDGTGAALGLVPVGTGNDTARALGVTPASALGVLARGRARAVDVGTLDWADAGGGGRRVFLNSVGMGFDAEVARAAARTKWAGGVTAYVAAVARTLGAARHPRPSASVHVAQPDGSSRCVLRGAPFLVEVGNGLSCGGGFLLTPDAVPDDGWLDVCAVRHLATGRALRLLPTVFRGGHVGAPEVCMARGVAVTVRSPTRGLPVHADGEAVSAAATRVAVGLRPGALRALAPGA